MAKLAVLVAIVLVAIASFFGGMRWQRETLGELQKWVLTEPIELSGEADRQGMIPAGAMLYEYNAMGETTTYVVFVNLKNRQILEEYDTVRDKRYNLVAPLTGWVVEEKE